MVNNSAGTQTLNSLDEDDVFITQRVITTCDNPGQRDAQPHARACARANMHKHSHKIHRNILEHTATRCNAWQQCNLLQHAAQHCHTLQQTATRCAEGPPTNQSNKSNANRTSLHPRVGEQAPEGRGTSVIF